jgi:hypothetical protein
LEASAAVGSESSGAPELTAFRKSAADINARHVSQLIGGEETGEVVIFEPVVVAGGDASEGLRSEGDGAGVVPAPSDSGFVAVQLCVGCKVLLTRNVSPEQGLVNGSLGTLVRFSDRPGGIASPAQPYPRLPVVAWSDGSLETVVEPVVAHALDEEFAAERGRMAGERERGSGNESSQAVRRNPAAGVSAGSFSSQRPVRPGDVVYMPLICAWGITVHRAQGMTLPSAIVHVSTMRTPALLYTALSRVRTLGGLKIRGAVNAENIIAHRAVVEYYTRLEQMIAASAEGAAEGEPALVVVPSEALQLVVDGS